MKSSDSSRWFVRIRTMLFLIFALAGALIMVLSTQIERIRGTYLQELLKELGIVLFSVFTVSLIYEWLLSDIHIEKFRELLLAEREALLANTKACADLGILKIYPQRTIFEIEKPFKEVMADIGRGSRVRIVAVTLFHIMNKAEFLTEAITRGATIELCLLSPQTPPEVLIKVPGLKVEDIEAALSVFRDKVANWVAVKRPRGQVDLRYHDTPTFESLARFSGLTDDWIAWDLSFGRDTTEKRIFLLDPRRPLGDDLQKRFDFIFEHAEVAFQYRQGQVVANNLKL